MSQRTISYTGTLVRATCWCGIEHAIPEALDRAITQGSVRGYCPLGHAYACTPSEADRQRSRADEAERRLAAERDLRLDTERRLVAQKGATTRATTRAAAGVCPCCNRSFSQLRRHMASKHPDYDPGGTKP